MKFFADERNEAANLIETPRGFALDPIIACRPVVGLEDLLALGIRVHGKQDILNARLQLAVESLPRDEERPDDWWCRIEDTDILLQGRGRPCQILPIEVASASPSTTQAMMFTSPLANA